MLSQTPHRTEGAAWRLLPFLGTEALARYGRETTAGATAADPRAEVDGGSWMPARHGRLSFEGRASGLREMSGGGKAGAADRVIHAGQDDFADQGVPSVAPGSSACAKYPEKLYYGLACEAVGVTQPPKGEVRH